MHTQPCSRPPDSVCNQCPKAECRANVKGSTKPGPSTGALAGAVVGIVLFAILCALGYFWWRRRTSSAGAPSEKSLQVINREVPANPDAVLSRPDPQEKHYSNAASLALSAGQFHQQPHAPSIVTDPFSDHASIQTASARTQSPNVITIGLIPAPDGITPLQPMPQSPRRPERAPDLVLRAPDPYDKEAQHQSLQPPTARFAKRQSAGTAITASSIASSAFSSTSSTMDILNETPQIRQVLGVTKAEVVQVSSSHAGSAATSPTGSLHPPSPLSRGGRSPLSQASFTPDDVDEHNPFDDGHLTGSSSASSIRSTSTFGQRTPTQWTFPPSPAYPDSRPTSMQSTAGTIIAQVGSATRVVFGQQVATPVSSRMPTIITSGASLSVPGRGSSAPPSPNEDTDADSARRMSHASEVSVASSRAEASILDAFPFVPPSPIAARPPRSPLGVTFTPPSPAKSAQNFAAQQQQPQTNSRATKGLSAMSASSGLSGLGDYTFKFPGPETPPVPGFVNEAQNSRRASLDTIALSRDVEAFPLSSYDDPLRSADHARDSFAPSSKS